MQVGDPQSLAGWSPEMASQTRPNLSVCSPSAISSLLWNSKLSHSPSPPHLGCSWEDRWLLPSPPTLWQKMIRSECFRSTRAKR